MERDLFYLADYAQRLRAMSDERLDAESERLVTLEIEAALIRAESMRRRLGGDVGSCDPSSDDTSQTGTVVEMRRRA